MEYHDQSVVKLGDIVSVPVPEGTAKARVVMLGDTYEHLEIDRQFLSWVKEEKVLKADSIVVEWIANNAFTHEDPPYAPVGEYMFTAVDEWVKREA